MARSGPVWLGRGCDFSASGHRGSQGHRASCIVPSNLPFVLECHPRFQAIKRSWFVLSFLLRRQKGKWYCPRVGKTLRDPRKPALC